MAILDKFRQRNQQQDNSVLPTEVNEYYQSEQDGRRGVAFLLGIVTLVITLVVAGALFLGGRFVYRKIVNNDQPSTTQTNKAADQNQTAQKATPSPQPPGNSKSTTGSNAITPPPTASSPGSNPAPSSSIPNTGDESSALPDTGDNPL